MDYTLEEPDRSPIHFLYVQTREAVFRDSREDLPDGWRADLERLAISLEVSVKVPSSETHVDVTLRTIVRPPEGLDLFTELSVAVEGRFESTKANNQDQLRDFAIGQAPLILWPYVRQAISQLTAQSRFGGILLPPVNMQRVVNAMRERAKTLGSA